MMMRWATTLLVGFCVLSASPRSRLGVAAEEAAEAAAEGAEAASGEATAGDEEGVNMEESAQELSDKLQQLKALLDAKGDNADPELKARLDALQGQLGALGLGDMMGGGGAGLAPSQELTEFLTGCVAMSLRRAGAQRVSTVSALRRLADDKLTPEEASRLDLWRMVGACINDLTEQELERFKAGEVSMLPKAYVEASKKPEVEEQIKGLDEQIWKELKVISAALLRELVGDTEEQKPPVKFAALFAIPLLLAVGFLAYKFFEVSKEGNSKKDKKKKNSGKKSQ